MKRKIQACEACEPAERICATATTLPEKPTDKRRRIIPNTQPLPLPHLRLQEWLEYLDAESPVTSVETLEDQESWDDMAESQSGTQSSRTTQRTRSSSPRKSIPTDGTYRNHLHRAKVNVDVEAPAEISEKVTAILGVKRTPEDEVLLRNAAERWRKKSNIIIAGRNIGEAQWTANIGDVLTDIAPAGLRAENNRDWNSGLKPQAPPLRSSIPQKRNRGDLRRTVQDNFAGMSGTMERRADNIATGATQDPPSPTTTAELRLLQSEFPGTGTPQLAAPTEPILTPAPEVLIKAPRPDIFVGLDHDHTNRLIQLAKDSPESYDTLSILQTNGILISDPVVSMVNTHFPFLIIEAKSGATGGNQFQAQNQAAVSGASALKILRSLARVQGSEYESESEPEPGPESQTELEAGFGRSQQKEVPELVFSITTEGPVHEIWAHYRDAKSDEFYMTCIGVWRITIASSALQLTDHIAAILRWGNEKLKGAVVEKLSTLPRRDLFGG
ncbi:hypothetical protein LTR04_007291 [Oleoguttula sp. CCFEE 6159]|nr:hypothetical protein LTR04_007291 [Oleoguttula sp. CCFEE 6159]